MASHSHPLHIEWPRSWPISFSPWLVSPHTILKNPTFCTTHKGGKGGTMGGYDIIWCQGPLYFSSLDPSINKVKQKLQQDPLLPQRTNMSIQQTVTLLEFSSKTHFLFQGKYYQQVHDAAMGSHISPLIANLFMEEFKVKALSSAPHPLSVAKVCGWYFCHPEAKETANNYYNTSTHRTHIYNSP